MHFVSPGLLKRLRGERFAPARRHYTGLPGRSRLRAVHFGGKCNEDVWERWFGVLVLNGAANVHAPGAQSLCQRFLKMAQHGEAKSPGMLAAAHKVRAMIVEHRGVHMS